MWSNKKVYNYELIDKRKFSGGSTKSDIKKCHFSNVQKTFFFFLNGNNVQKT